MAADAQMKTNDASGKAAIASRQLELFVYDDRIVRAFLLAVIFWGIVAFLVGLIVAVELAFPLLNLGLPYIAFGRLHRCTRTPRSLPLPATPSSRPSIIPRSGSAKPGCSMTV